MGFIFTPSAYGQFGYQVALIDNATGNPRAFETVTVQIQITNVDGKVLYKGTKQETTNDFGILSMSVGDADTFSDVDWSKLPFYISATLDGILIGSTQILTVPVAEHAKHTGTLTKDLLCSTTWHNEYSEVDMLYEYYTFYQNGTVIQKEIYIYDGHSRESTQTYKYCIDGNTIILIGEKYSNDWASTLRYVPEENIIVGAIEGLYLKP